MVFDHKKTFSFSADSILLRDASNFVNNMAV